MEILTGIRIDGEAGGAVSATNQVERALDEVAQSAKEAGRDVGAGMAQVTSASKAAGVATDDLRAKQAALVKQAKLVAFQNQQLGFQLNDFFVQVASGQSPITAAIQQGSQLSGTYGGIGNAVKAVTALITPARVAMAGLGGAAATVGALIYQGAQQTNEFNKSIQLTGNYAGITAGQFDAMAQRISAGANTSIGGARETLQALVSSGNIGSQALQPMSSAIEKITLLTGQSREEVIKNFTQMAAQGPVKMAEALNKSYNMMTMESMQLVKSLQESGREGEAFGLVLQALDGRLGTVSQNLGLFESIWQGITKAVSGAADAVRSFGRELTPEQQMAQLKSTQANLLAAPESASKGDRARRAQALATIQEEIQVLGRKILKTQEVAAAEGMRAKQRKDEIEADQKWGRIADANLSRGAAQAKQLKEIADVGTKSGKSKEQIRALQADYLEKNKGPDKSAELKALADAEYNNKRVALEGIAAIEKRTVDDRIRTNEQLYKLGLLDIRAYYDEKTALEQESIAIQEKLIGKELELAKTKQKGATREVDKLTSATQVKQLQNQLDELSARKDDARITNSNARALALDADLKAIEKSMEEVEKRLNSGAFQQQLGWKDQIFQLKTDQIKDPMERQKALQERERQRMQEMLQNTTLNESDRLDIIKTYNEKIALENDALAERMKPGWKKMLDEWSNSALLMKTTYDQAIEGMLRSGEQEFIRSKGNIGSTFKAMLKELEADLLRFAYRNSIGQLLGGFGKSGGGSGIGGILSGGGGGGAGGILGGIFNPAGTPFNPFAGGGFTDVGGLGSAASSFLASIFHTGIGPGEKGSVTRSVPASVFTHAPRFHQGVGPGERAAIIRKEEGVFTPAQMRALSPVGQNTEIKINVINQSGQDVQASASRNSDGSVEVILRRVKDSVASDIANGEGSVFGAIQGRFGLRTAVA